MNQSNISTTPKKYEPHLDELTTDEEQIKRVRELILEAITWQGMCVDFDRNGVTKPLYFLQIFARESKKLPVERVIALLREGMDSTGTGTLHYHRMRDAIELLTEKGEEYLRQ